MVEADGVWWGGWWRLVEADVHNESDPCSSSVLTLDTRQKRAEELRRLTDRSASMSEEQLSELRAEIKVIERPCLFLHVRPRAG